MKRGLVIVVSTLLMSIVLFSGCNETTTEKLVTTPLIALALSLDDLPEGYVKWSEEQNYSDEAIKGINPAEFYFVTFAFGEIDMNHSFPAIAFYMYKFNSSSDAHIVTQNISEQTFDSLDDGLNRTTPQNIEQIGDESIYELFEGNMGEYYSYINATWSFIYFRIKNVAVGLLLEGIAEWDIDYVNLTLSYAKIVENRINLSLN